MFIVKQIPHISTQNWLSSAKVLPFQAADWL